MKEWMMEKDKMRAKKWKMNYQDDDCDYDYFEET